jgi:hypothetical protein
MIVRLNTSNTSNLHYPQALPTNDIETVDLIIDCSAQAVRHVSNVVLPSMR